MDTLLVLTGASLLIGFIVWWFFGNHASDEVEATMQESNRQEVEVVVDGGYAPNTVVLKQGVPADRKSVV